MSPVSWTWEGMLFPSLSATQIEIFCPPGPAVLIEKICLHLLERNMTQSLWALYFLPGQGAIPGTARPGTWASVGMI